jgi:archaellum component FlaD/FlaE
MEGSQKKELSFFELANELYTLVEHNVISSFIADKIKEKVKDAGVKLTKNHLYELVDNIKKAIRIQRRHPQPYMEKKESVEGVNYDDVDVEGIFNMIEKLGRRIERIEEVQNNGGNGRSPGSHISYHENVFAHPREGKNHLLEEISNDPESIIVLMKWLQYLMDKVGKANLSNVLEYYADIGWISDKSIKNILEYSQGIAEEKEPDGKSNNHELSKLQAKDHIQSLLFIQRLKGEQPDDYFLSKIERDISKMTKNLSNMT